MASLAHAAARWLDRVTFALAVLAVAILVALVCGVTFEVVMRYAFGRPTRWVIEFSEYALVYLAFLGGAWVLREEGHVKVELLIETLSERNRRRFHVVTSWIGAAVCALFCWVSIDYVAGIYESGEVLFRSVQVKKWAVMAVIPLGLALIALQFVRRALVAPDAAHPGGA